MFWLGLLISLDSREREGTVNDRIEIDVHLVSSFALEVVVDEEIDTSVVVVAVMVSSLVHLVLVLGPVLDFDLVLAIVRAYHAHPFPFDPSCSYSSPSPSLVGPAHAPEPSSA
jgi:hypothetical protein